MDGEKMHTKSWPESQNGRNHPEYVGVEGGQY